MSASDHLGSGTIPIAFSAALAARRCLSSRRSSSSESRLIRCGVGENEGCNTMGKKNARSDMEEGESNPITAEIGRSSSDVSHGVPSRMAEILSLSNRRMTHQTWLPKETSDPIEVLFGFTLSPRSHAMLARQTELAAKVRLS